MNCHSTTPAPSTDAAALPPSLRSSHAPLQLGYFLMGASLMFFVVNNLVIRWAGTMAGADAWLATACRFVIGLAVVAALYLPGKRLNLGALLQRPVLIVRGVLGGLGIYIFYITLPVLGAGRATVINSSYVLFSVILAGPCLGERLTRRKLGWLVAGCAGIALLCGGSSLVRPVGVMDALALFGAVLAAGCVIAIRELSATQHFSTIFASQCFYGLAMAAVPAGASTAQPGLLLWGAMVLGGTLAAAGQLTMTRAFKDLPVATGGAIHMLSPVLCALGGAVLFQERYAPLELIGGALTLLSCYMVLSAPSAPRSEVAPVKTAFET